MENSVGEKIRILFELTKTGKTERWLKIFSDISRASFLEYKIEKKLISFVKNIFDVFFNAKVCCQIYHYFAISVVFYNEQNCYIFK